ncbi:MAG TPA: hypothetical protein VHU90_12415, partial [Galbitalea sp.]|nr:hypothetical protein [Galbitalea sp.]
MKKIFAALTAVTIAVGLSLATAVAPASADDGTTPTATPTPVASSTPPATPTDPAPTPNVTPTAPVVPAVMTAVTADTTFTVVSNNTQVHKAFVCKYVGTPGVNERLQTGQNPIDVDTHSIAESPVVVGSYFNDAQGRSYVLALDTGQPDPSVSSCPNPTPTYETVVWSMPSPFDGSDATYPQVGVTQYKGETTEDLDVAVPTTCGTQYQVDVYAQTFGSTNNTSAIDALFASGLAGPNGAQDGSYLAGAGNNPGVYGLGHAWKFVQNATCPPPCIPDSQVSYTYSNDLSNSGDITVPTVQGSSGQLCEPFYVTATSWKYTTNAVWPQVIDQVDHVNGPPSGGNNIKISASGTYHYAAPVTCGQGDIYASFTSNDATLFPENDGLPGIGYLNGPSNPFSEHFLSDMGFHGPNPTYIQGQTSCWKPIQETGWPTTSTLSCTQGSSNSLSLPVVPGGEWTVSNGNHNYSYNKTYPMGTGVTNWVPTNFTGSYTITLTDGSSTDSYQVTGTTSHWTPQNPRTLDCNTVITPTKPTVNPIDQCGVDGSVTIPNTPGVIYEHNGRVVSGTITGLHGSYSVTATAASGYEFSVGATSHWTFQLGSELKDCTVTQVLGSCTASNSDSTKSVSLKLDNASSSVSSSFEVKIEGTSYDQTFVVNAHTTSTVSINNATTAGETIDVYINGSNRATQICILPFPGCVVTNVPADPSHTDISCTGNNTVLGSITVDGNPELTYTLHLPGGSTEVFPSGQPSTISGLVAGNYSVTVVANPGFVLGGSGSFPATVTILNAVDCIGTELTPVVSSVTPSCAPN